MDPILWSRYTKPRPAKLLAPICLGPLAPESFTQAAGGNRGGSLGA